jgi:hypothetical protein
VDLTPDEAAEWILSGVERGKTRIVARHTCYLLVKLLHARATDDLAAADRWGGMRY